MKRFIMSGNHSSLYNCYKCLSDLIRRTTKIETGSVKPYEDNMLKIVGENRKLTLDMRALDDSIYSDIDSDKLNQVVDDISPQY